MLQNYGKEQEPTPKACQKLHTGGFEKQKPSNNQPQRDQLKEAASAARSCGRGPSGTFFYQLIVKLYFSDYKLKAPNMYFGQKTESKLGLMLHREAGGTARRLARLRGEDGKVCLTLHKGQNPV